MFMPIPAGINKFVFKEVTLPPLAELNDTTPKNRGRGTIGKFKTKIMTKKKKRRRNAYEGLADMYKRRKLKNPVRGKMVKRNTIIIKEAAKKIRHWQAKARPHKVNKKNHLRRRTAENSMLTGQTPT